MQEIGDNEDETTTGGLSVRKRYYRKYPSLVIVAGILWVLFALNIYRDKSAEGQMSEMGYVYNELAVVDRYGSALLMAEQAEGMNLIERWIAGVEEKSELQGDTIRFLENARQKGLLTGVGGSMLACLYWEAGNGVESRRLVKKYSEGDDAYIPMMQCIQSGGSLTQEQWDYLEADVRGQPRSWIACFLVEKAVAVEAGGRMDFMLPLVEQRRRDVLLVNACLSIAVWVVFVAGMAALFRLARNQGLLGSGGARSAQLGGAGLASGERYLPRLWPVSLAAVVFILGDMLGEVLYGVVWMLTSDDVSELGFMLLDIGSDALFRGTAVVVLVWVFFKRADYFKRTFFQPVPKLMHWVLASLAVVWVLDLGLYSLPGSWFPVDQTLGFQRDYYGWGGLATGFVASVVLAPICEEVMFRGVLYNVFKNRFGHMAGMLLSSLIFASLHFYGFQDLLAVFLFGVVMVWLYRRTNSLLPGVICHALLNLIITTWNWVLFSSPESFWLLGN